VRVKIQLLIRPNPEPRRKPELVKFFRLPRLDLIETLCRKSAVPAPYFASIAREFS
jgi:hypothetical protein